MKPCPDDYCLDYNSATPPTRCIVVKGGRWDNRIWEAQPAEHFKGCPICDNCLYNSVEGGDIVPYGGTFATLPEQQICECDDLYDEERLCEKDEVQEYRAGSKVCPYFSRKS